MKRARASRCVLVALVAAVGCDKGDGDGDGLGGGDASSPEGFAIAVAADGCEIRATYLECAADMGGRLCQFDEGDVVVTETCRNELEGEVLTALIDDGITDENWADYEALAENCLAAITDTRDGASCATVEYDSVLDCYWTELGAAYHSSCDAFYDTGLVPI